MTRHQVVRSLCTIAVLGLFSLYAAEIGRAVAQSAEAPAGSAGDDVVETFQKDAEQVGDKTSELGDSIGETADGVADGISTEAEKAYQWSRKKGEEAYEWSRKQLHDLTN